MLTLLEEVQDDAHGGAGDREGAVALEGGGHTNGVSPEASVADVTAGISANATRSKTASVSRSVQVTHKHSNICKQSRKKIKNRKRRRRRKKRELPTKRKQTKLRPP
jgi:hypothetical protein